MILGNKLRHSCYAIVYPLFHQPYSWSHRRYASKSISFFPDDIRFGLHYLLQFLPYSYVNFGVM